VMNAEAGAGHGRFAVFQHEKSVSARNGQICDLAEYAEIMQKLFRVEYTLYIAA